MQGCICCIDYILSYMKRKAGITHDSCSRVRAWYRGFHGHHVFCVMSWQWYSTNYSPLSSKSSRACKDWMWKDRCYITCTFQKQFVFLIYLVNTFITPSTSTRNHIKTCSRKRFKVFERSRSPADPFETQAQARLVSNHRRLLLPCIRETEPIMRGYQVALCTHMYVTYPCM